MFDRIGKTFSEQNPSNTELFLKLESFPPVLLAKCIKFPKKINKTLCHLLYCYNVIFLYFIVEKNSNYNFRQFMHDSFPISENTSKINHV